MIIVSVSLLCKKCNLISLFSHFKWENFKGIYESKKVKKIIHNLIKNQKIGFLIEEELYQLWKTQNSRYPNISYHQIGVL